MTDRDRCTDTNPHPAHRTQYGGFGLKDCPGVPMTRPEELREERVKTGRLEGDLRSQTRAVREALAERDEAARICGEAGIEIDRLRAERDEALDDRDQARRERDQLAADNQATADNNDRLRAILAATAEALHLNTGVDPNHIPATAAAARDAAHQLAAFRQGVIDRHRQELGAAGDVLAVVRDAMERIDRALATYDTTPGEEEADADAVQNLLDDSTRAFAAADTSSERVEVIRDLLAGWYAHWPKTAVTDPHEGIAWQIASLISAAEARASGCPCLPGAPEHRHGVGGYSTAPAPEGVS